jgi:hypothetical protein
MTTTTDYLNEQAKSWPHTYDGIPVWEIGDEGEWLVAIGHVDKATFAKACDAYYRAVSHHSLAEVYDGATTLAEVAEDATHRKADIRHLEEFPHGDFAVLFDEGDVDVTTWTAY